LGIADFSNDSDALGDASDALGDAYEYLIGQFAAGGGKKAGEFYTPKQVSNILSIKCLLQSPKQPTTLRSCQLCHATP
jgi:type I restriction enzyme M protein